MYTCAEQDPQFRHVHKIQVQSPMHTASSFHFEHGIGVNPTARTTFHETMTVVSCCQSNQTFKAPWFEGEAMRAAKSEGPNGLLNLRKAF